MNYYRLNYPVPECSVFISVWRICVLLFLYWHELIILPLGLSARRCALLTCMHDISGRDESQGSSCFVQPIAIGYRSYNVVLCDTRNFMPRYVSWKSIAILDTIAILDHAYHLISCFCYCRLCCVSAIIHAVTTSFYDELTDLLDRLAILILLILLLISVFVINKN